MITVRQVTVDDWPVWRDMRLAALADAPYAFNSRLADWADGGEQQWRGRLALPGSYNVVAFADDRPVGMARGVPRADGTSELHSMWVSPEVRGQGVGDRLMSAVEEWATRSGSSMLELAVFPGNDAAIALYERHGYRDTGERGGLLRDGVTRELVLTKRLHADSGPRRPPAGDR